VLPINHMVVVSQSLSRDHPEAVREICRLLRQSAALAQAEGMQAAPPHFSHDEMSRSLETISQYAAQQGLIPRAYAADELFDDLTRTLR
jgi:4,5-dihydroxyphthalate decarboxylase